MTVKIQQLPIYRMVHYNNVEHLLSHGMCCKTHTEADPDYINIGDTTLILQRNEYPVGINPPGGQLGDFVPFYFSGHTPMLFNIKTGYRGIVRRPQEDIIFICCTIGRVIELCQEWCFTDGHAKNRLTEFYNDLNHLHTLDWDTIHNQWWHASEDDMDRPRKKQAEFLVKEKVPVGCINSIIVHNQQRKENIEELIQRKRLQISVIVDESHKLYYP